ncbi:MAG: DNA-binding protein [Candidatus Omnitrophica bacterium]|jgi:hypothetical protein|nr:DNA-binding protein [Candidatus Omnitrophota bacterium]
MNKLKMKNAKRKTIIKNLKLYILSFSFAFFACSFALTCFAQAVSSNDLIKNAKFYDGKIVVYKGEAVGEVMPRGEFSWVNILEGNNAIGAWMPLDLSRQINFCADYKHKGDIIEITGVFNNACKQHGGDLDIHVLSLRKIQDGAKIIEDLDKFKTKLAITLFAGFILILILGWALNKR